MDLGTAVLLNNGPFEYKLLWLLSWFKSVVSLVGGAGSEHQWDCRDENWVETNRRQP